MNELDGWMDGWMRMDEENTDESMKHILMDRILGSLKLINMH